MTKLIERLQSDQEKDIYRQLGKYCAYRERAESEVWEKLKTLEVSEDLSYRLIALLIQDKFLNNKRYARFYAQGKFLNNKWGKQKIRTNLKSKKINNELISYALDRIDQDQYIETINVLIEKKANNLKMSTLFVFRKKIVDFIRMKGYEADIVWDLVKKKFPDK